MLNETKQQILVDLKSSTDTKFKNLNRITKQPNKYVEYHRRNT